MRNRDARSLPSEAQEDLRRQAVAAVLDGRSQVEVAGLFGVTRQAVGKWIRSYRDGGKRALRAGKRGRPRGGSLAGWQAAQVVRSITDRPPDQLKLPFCLWTREAVAQLIAERYDVELSVWTVGRYLKRWGLTPQKPLRRAWEQDSEQVRAWLKQTYPAIRRQAKREGAGIYWGDEMGLRSDHTAGRSWGRKGETPVIPGTGKRFRCNMISAITNRGELSFMVFERGFRAKEFIEFLTRLCRHADRKVFLIVDRHPVHRSRKVKAWLNANQERIRLFFLPPYSPELNPDEVLNQDVKTNALGRKRPHSLGEMMATVRWFLRSRMKRPHTVRRYFEEAHVRYAAA